MQKRKSEPKSSARARTTAKKSAQQQRKALLDLAAPDKGRKVKGGLKSLAVCGQVCSSGDHH